jgi:hypothetical protein
MNKDAKDGTKNVPPPTKDEDGGRVTAETQVTNGRSGIERTRALLKRILKAPKQA